MQNAMRSFDAVPNDVMKFGQGMTFDPLKVLQLLGLDRSDVSHLAATASSSVRYDATMPEAMRDRLEEIANTINMVAGLFEGDVNKTAAWFKARNPMLGDFSPRDMIRLGRYERLHKFILNAMAGRMPKQIEKAS